MTAFDYTNRLIRFWYALFILGVIKRLISSNCYLSFCLLMAHLVLLVNINDKFWAFIVFQSTCWNCVELTGYASALSEWEISSMKKQEMR